MESMIQKDFGDWLSPMIVKELRQGLRTRVFELAFLLIQALMIFCMLLSLAHAGSGDPEDSSSRLFWMTNAVLFFLVMPSRGLTVISSEVKGRTMELLFLTRITTKWIVLGKWMAIVVQTILIACTVLPYLVLRYFAGGIDIVNGVKALVIMLFYSAMLTAVAMAMSSFRSLFLRISGLFISLLALCFISALSANARSFGGAIVLIIVTGLPFLLLVFRMVTLRVSAPPENND